MSTPNCKPQQQTLSIRVPESLREFLELTREFITDARGEAVSISDAAKFLLESAKQDRLDFRLEAAELQPAAAPAIVAAAAILDDVVAFPSFFPVHDVSSASATLPSIR